MDNSKRTACEVFSRSMGYIRPVKHFNLGKYSEFLERNVFKENLALLAGARHQELLKDEIAQEELCDCRLVA